MGVVRENLPKFVDPLPGGGALINAVDYVVNWARASSLWPLVYGTSCCAIEMMATGSSKHDWARFGAEVARATPRQADLIILAGTLVEKMAPRLQTLYDQMASPKYVIAMGACTISGGPFYYDSYSVIKGADRIIPVDVYVPGCPPRPEALLNGIRELQKIIKGETIREERPLRPLHIDKAIDVHTDSSEEWALENDVKVKEAEGAREEFKKNNPDFKAYKHTKVAKEKFEEVERKILPAPGLNKVEIYEKVTQKFPHIGLFRIEEPNREKVEALGPEVIIDFEVPADQYLAFINYLKNHAELKMDYLIELTAVQWEEHIDIVVHLLSIGTGHKIFLRTSISSEVGSEIETISHIYHSAEWHEREVYDFFGVKFKNHPDMRRIFLEDHFPGHPLRKDFEDEIRVVKRPY